MRSNYDPLVLVPILTLVSFVIFAEPSTLLKVDSASVVEEHIKNAGPTGMTSLRVDTNRPLDLSTVEVRNTLEEYIQSPRVQQKEAAIGMYFVSMPFQRQKRVRRKVVDFVSTMLEPQEGWVAQSAARWLSEMSRDDFTANSKERLRQAFGHWVSTESTKGKFFILAVGAANIQAKMPALRDALIEREYEKQELGPQGAVSWYSRLALARMGDKSQVKYIVHATKQAEIRTKYNPSRLDQLAYIRSQESVELLYNLLMEDAYFSNERGIRPPENHAIRVAGALAKCVSDFPSSESKDRYAYTRDRLSDLRFWMANNRPWKIVPR